MIDIAIWRARIGLYNLSTGGPSGRRAKVLRPSAGEGSLLLALMTTAVEVVTLIIVSLLLLCGDVELNPGPGNGKNCKCASIIISSSYDTFARRIIAKRNGLRSISGHSKATYVGMVVWDGVGC